MTEENFISEMLTVCSRLCQSATSSSWQK